MLQLLILASIFSFCTARDHLIIHLVAHSHDDVGWLKTVDQYYMGANNSIQNAGVQYIIDTTISELEENPDRVFTWVEMAYFFRWWNEATHKQKERLHQLIQKGQWEFINGGWVQHDEANTCDEAQIIQMTRGHQFLKETFGISPTAAAQYDPFGHSTTSAHLNAKMGFSSLFFARIDYQDYAYRLNNSGLEFIWKPSVSEKTEIFSHVFWAVTYCAPSGFNFEDNNVNPLQNDPKIFNYNVQERSDEFAELMRQRASVYRTNEILAMMGCDFQYQNARINFKNLDKLIDYINSNLSRYEMTLKYSTPSRYATAVNTHPQTWPIKTDDFFPIAFRPHSYWAGFFTSRPALKAYIRTRGILLQSVNKLVSSVQHMLDVPQSAFDEIDVLTRDFSIAQHHDSVTGTSKQHVTNDYAMRLSIGTESGYRVLGNTFSSLINSQTKFSFCEYLNMSICPASTEPLKKEYLNMSICPAFTEPLRNGLSVPVVFYNNLGWTREEVVYIPIGVSNVEVLDSNSQKVPSHVISRDKTTVVAFFASVPPLGYQTYMITPSQKSKSKETSLNQVNSISNEYYTIHFDMKNGKVKDINGQPFSLDYFWYNSSSGNGPGDLSQASGAYMLRPNRTDPFLVNSSATISFQVNNVFQEATLVFSDWLQSVIRLYPSQNFVEVESTVGPIPIADGLGKEVILRLQTQINNAKTWYTDSNGEQMETRILNYRSTWPLQMNEQVASNYYPMTFSAYIENSVQRLSIVTDRARGCSSMNSGQLETMLHRRCLYDDHQGVGEPLNETEPIRTKERFMLTKPTEAPYRPQALLLNNFIVPSFGSPTNDPQSWMRANKLPIFSGLTDDLPSNVHLMTYEWSPESKPSALMRFRHLYGVNENGALGKPVSFEIENLFFGRKVVKLTEMTLTANQELSQLQTLKWKHVESKDFEAQEFNEESRLLAPFEISLIPLQIRTFLVEFSFGK